MQAHGGSDRTRFSRFGRLKGWAAPGLHALERELLLRDYEDTLRRLLHGGFADLDAAERRARVEQIITVSAGAAVAMAAAPVPFLEMPVLMAMVRAIAKVHGVERPGKRGLMHLVAALGGGLFFRQILRLVPFGGPLPLLSRVYGATWALGRVANVYYAGGETAGRDDLRRTFRDTLAAKSAEEARRLEETDFERRLAALKALREKRLISEEEYQAKRSALLALL